VSPLLSEDEMKYQLEDSDAKALVTLDAIFAARLVNIAEKTSPNLKLLLHQVLEDSCQ